MGEHDKALGYYKEALPLMEEVANPAGQAFILYNMGLTYARCAKIKKRLPTMTVRWNCNQH